MIGLQIDDIRLTETKLEGMRKVVVCIVRLT